MLIILSVFCVMLIVISSIKNEAFAPVRNAVGYVLVPVQKGINTIGTGIYNGISEAANLKQAAEENKELRAQLDTLTEENNRLRSDELELERLRSLYELDQQYMQYPKIAARVIAKDSEKWFQVFRIDKGSADGIAPDMNVMCGGGLLGIVTEVGANYATVRSIIDDESRVSAMSQHSADTCIVAGDLKLFEEGKLRISNIDKNASIADGDAIVTSNISTKFLPGILIGYASDIAVDSKQLTKSGTLVPVADFDNLQEVFVITQTKTGLLEGMASGDTSSEAESEPAASSPEMSAEDTVSAESTVSNEETAAENAAPSNEETVVESGASSNEEPAAESVAPSEGGGE